MQELHEKIDSYIEEDRKAHADLAQRVEENSKKIDEIALKLGRYAFAGIAFGEILTNPILWERISSLLNGG